MGAQPAHHPHARTHVRTRRCRRVGGLAARTSEVELREGRVAVELSGQLLASLGAEFVFCSTQGGCAVGAASVCGERSAMLHPPCACACACACVRTGDDHWAWIRTSSRSAPYARMPCGVITSRPERRAQRRPPALWARARPRSLLAGRGWRGKWRRSRRATLRAAGCRRRHRCSGSRWPCATGAAPWRARTRRAC